MWIFCPCATAPTEKIAHHLMAVLTHDTFGVVLYRLDRVGLVP